MLLLLPYPHSLMPLVLSVCIFRQLVMKSEPKVTATWSLPDLALPVSMREISVVLQNLSQDSDTHPSAMM